MAMMTTTLTRIVMNTTKCAETMMMITTTITTAVATTVTKSHIPPAATVAVVDVTRLRVPDMVVAREVTASSNAMRSMADGMTRTMIDSAAADDETTMTMSMAPATAVSKKATSV